MGLDDLARAAYDGWCGGECAAAWEQVGDRTKDNHRAAARAVVLVLADPLVIVLDALDVEDLPAGSPAVAAYLALWAVVAAAWEAAPGAP